MEFPLRNRAKARLARQEALMDALLEEIALSRADSQRGREFMAQLSAESRQEWEKLEAKSEARWVQLSAESRQEWEKLEAKSEARWVQLSAESRQSFETMNARSDDQIQLTREAMRRHEIAFQGVMRAVQALVDEMSGLREDSRAQTKAIFSLIDLIDARLPPPQGQAA